MTMNRMVRRSIVVIFLLLPLVGGGLLIPDVRRNLYYTARAVLRPEPPAPITPLAIAPPPTRTATATTVPTGTTSVAAYQPTPVLLPDLSVTPEVQIAVPSATQPPAPTPTATSLPTIEPSATTEPPPPVPSATSEPIVTLFDPSITPEVLLPAETGTMLDPLPSLPTIDPTLAPLPPIIEPSATSGPPTSTPDTGVAHEPAIPPPPMVEVNGRLYDVYTPAALKSSQQYQYSCEFDAAWVIVQTFGINVSVDELISSIPIDRSIEPYILETPEGAIIYGGDIINSYSGDYTANFLARSTGHAIRRVFEQFGLNVWPVQDRPGVEAALRSGALVWMKTTVDFKPWRPATWIMPDGNTHQTVLGNDHAVVVIGFNDTGVVIRDVLGPTSSNWERPYEYEVDWDTFLASWGAQSFDGLAVAPQ